MIKLDNPLSYGLSFDPKGEKLTINTEKGS